MADLLIVEDDPDAADALAEILHLEGHTVRIAYNGQEGLVHLKRQFPDVVLLDIEMPVLDGPGMAYRMFLHNAGMEDIPVVLLSGVPTVRSIANEVGTPYFLPKPYTFEQLIAMVERVLAERAAPHPAHPA